MSRSAAAGTPAPRWVVPGAVLGLVSVTLYVTGWLVAGMLTEGFDPFQQAISETFDLGAPAVPRAIATAGLALSSVGLVAIGPVLHVGLPGTQRAGPVLASLSGVFSLLVAVFPCTDGCPGFGTTTTDTLHVLFAALGYLCLLLAPLVVGVRLRPHLRGLAWFSISVGALALLAFAVRNLGPDTYGGLQQRVFNTLADLWYVVAAIVVVRRVRSARTPPPADPSGRTGSERSRAG